MMVTEKRAKGPAPGVESDPVEARCQGIERRRLFSVGFIIFFLALSIRLWFAFFDGHQTQVNALDAAEYVRNGRAVQEFISSKSSNFWLNSILDGFHLLPAANSLELHAQYGTLSELITRSGPVYPGFIAVGLTLGAPFFGPDSLNGPVILQCLLGAVTCLLVGVTAYQIFDLRAGFYSGVIAALYPGFIVNTVRLISESFASFWAALVISLAVALLTGSRKKPLLAFALGLSLAILQLTRSALVLLSIVTLFMGLFLLKKKSAPTSLGCLVAGMAIVLFGFVSLQALIVGSGTLVVDRLSHYNLLVGLNLDSLGWLAYPLPNLALAQNLSYLEIIRFEFLQGPSRFLSLMLDKVPRLFAWPFNDFHSAIGGLNCFGQIVIHQVCLALAATGAVLSLFRSGDIELKKPKPNGVAYARIYLVVFISLHLAYMFFVSMARYALTAMPAVIVFSGFGAAVLFSKLAQVGSDARRSVMFFLLSVSILMLLLDLDFTGAVASLWGFDHFNKVASFLVAVKVISFSACVYWIYRLGSFQGPTARFGLSFLALLTVPFIALPLAAYGPNAEWTAPLDRAWPEAVQLIKADGRTESGQSYLIVDCPDWTTLGQSTKVYVNGKEIDTTAMPLLPLNGINNKPKLRGDGSVYYEFEDVLNSMFNAVGGSVLNMRQWFLLPVPEGIFDSGSILRVRVAVKPGHETRLFGSYSSRRGQVSIPGLEMHSWDKLFYGIENIFGLSDARYVTKFNIQNSNQHASTSDLSSAFGLQTGQLGVRLLCTDSEFRKGRSEARQAVEIDLGGATDGFTKEISLNSPSFANLDPDSFWLISVRGSFHSGKKERYRLPVNMSMRVATGKEGEKNHRVYNSPWMPSSLVAIPGENQFAFTIPLKPSGFEGRPETVVFSVQPGGRAESRELFGVGLPRSDEAKIEWKQLSVEFEQLNQSIDVNSARIY